MSRVGNLLIELGEKSKDANQVDTFIWHLRHGSYK